MYKAAVNFLRGQVLVHIESGCPERVVNLCAGAEVVYLEDLTAQVLAGDEELRRRFVEETIRRAGSTAMGYRGDLKRYLLDIQDPLELVLKTMEGVSYQDVFPNEQGRLSSLVHTGARFLMPPIPNLYFTRDPFACIGRGVSLNHMFTDTRNRETLYGDLSLIHISSPRDTR